MAEAFKLTNVKSNFENWEYHLINQEALFRRGHDPRTFTSFGSVT